MQFNSYLFHAVELEEPMQQRGLNKVCRLAQTFIFDCFAYRNFFLVKRFEQEKTRNPQQRKLFPYSWLFPLLGW